MKKLMVIFIAVVFVLGIFILAYAQSPEGAKPQGKVSIEERKAKLISGIDGRINSLQELKSCVSAGQTHEDLRKCRTKFEQERKELWEERKEQRGK
jgi:sensor domain CHASE-containing protein